jgi:hypothetical protein
MSGIRAGLVALLLVAARQEEPLSVDALIDRLADDRVDVRDSAAAALERLDRTSVPDLRKRLDRLGLDARLRLEDVIRRIHERYRFLEYLPEYKPVSLTLVDVAPRDALLALREKTGLPLDIDSLPPGRNVTVDLVDQTPLQALHAICRAAMIGYEVEGGPDWRERTRGPGPGRIRFHGVVDRYYRPMATAFVRHYRIRATVDDWEQAIKESQQTISLSIVTAPGVRPYSYSTLKLTALTDDAGNDLLPRVLPRKDGFARPRFYSRGAGAGVHFARPPGANVRVARLAGSITFRYPRRVRWVRFAPLTPPFGRLEEGLGLQFLLRGYEHQGIRHTLDLDIVSPGGGLDVRKVDQGLPFDFDEIELRTAGGETLKGGGSSGAGGSTFMSYTLSYRSTKDEPAVEVRLPWADEFVEDVVEFDLRDLRGMNE